MKAYVNTAPGQMQWQDPPTPEPTAGQVRIRTAACGICATEMEMIAGWERTGFPSIPGHEWVGWVDAVGPGVDDALIGRFCVAENVLGDGGEIGFEHPGGYAQYLITEAKRVCQLPDDFPLDAATLIEPLAVAMRGYRRLGGDFGKPVLLFGDGPIGLLMLHILARRGIKNVVVVGGRPNRLELARALGAAQVLNYHAFDCELVDAIRSECGAGFPTVIEASGTPSAMDATLDLAAPGGKILVLGDYGSATAQFRWNRILHGEIVMIGSNASRDAWPDAVDLAIEEPDALKRLISKKLPIDRFDEGIRLTREDREIVKVVMIWD